MNVLRSLLESPDVARLGWVLVHSLWELALAAAGLSVALIVLRNRGARARYLAGCTAMVAVVAFPLVTFFVLGDAGTGRGEVKSIAASKAATSSGVTPTQGAPMDAWVRGGAAGALPRGLAENEMPDGIRMAGNARVSVEAPKPARVTFAEVLPWLVMLWVVGVTALSVWNLGGWVALRRLKSMRTNEVGQELLATLERLCGRLKVGRPVGLLESAVARTPMMIGVLRPVILLPASVLCELPAAQLESILAHELGHVMRQDYLVNLIQTALETLLYYHPAVWWISRRIRAERENCCDDIAMGVTGDRADYARALAAIAGASGPALAPAASGGMLLARVRRVMGLPEAEARRSGRWAAGLMGLGVCALVAAMVAVPSRSKAEQAKTPATQPAGDQRTLRLVFVDGKTNRPVAGATGTYWPDKQTQTNWKKYSSDEHGEALLAFDKGAKSVSFFYRKEGFVEGMMNLGGEFGVAPLSDTYTLRLRPGLKIGGVVKDDQGKPVEGAKLQLTFTIANPDNPRLESVAYGNPETDKEGKWTFSGAPENPSRIQVFVHHPDFVLKSLNHEYSAADFDVLRRGEIISQVRRGVTIAGTITDKTGKPISGAGAAANGFGIIGSTETDAQGRFELRGVDPETRQLAFKADGYAPELVEIDGRANLKVQLEKGRVFHGQVVDSHGKPVPDAYVSVEKWRTISRFGVGMKTDAEGKFVWNGAPDDGFTLRTNGSWNRDPTAVKAAEDNVVIRLPAEVVARGTVVDGATGQPVKRFTVHIAGNKGRTGFSMDRQGNDGAFEVRGLDQADNYTLRINADGYLPLDSEKLTSRDDVVRFDARMGNARAGGGKSGSVLTPDGKPAVGADVMLIEQGAASVENGVLSSWSKTANVSVVTDANGRFVLPKRTGDIKLFMYHESGWSIVKQKAEQPMDGMKLRGWCTVEGVVIKDGKPAAGQTVWLRPTTHAGDTLYERQQFMHRLVTDAQGKFKLNRVIDGTSEIGLMVSHPMGDGRMSFTESQTIGLNLAPGEHKTGIQIGGVGRPVVGKLVVPDDLRKQGLIPHEGELTLRRPQFVPPAGWENLSEAQKQPVRDAFAKSDAMKEYEKRTSTFAVIVKDDGTFRADDVPAGEYSLWIDVQTPTPGEPNNYRWAASAGKEVVVPGMSGGKSDQALDVGVLTLEAHHYLEAGQMAPDFKPMTYDGKRLDLASYRGKYVLMCFWATWCGPCIAEMKQLEELRQKLGNDPRFVLISVSVDSRIEEPTQFLKNRPLAWTQGYAGNASPQSAFRAFGVGAIPSNWLIGPDGKILAEGFEGNAIEKIVVKAMANP